MLTLQGQPHQQFIDFILPHGMVVPLFSGVDTLGIGGDEAEHLGRHKVVVDDHVGLPEQSCGAQRKQIRVSRSRPHQVNPSPAAHQSFVAVGIHERREEFVC
jgi:hypothetical protein